MEYIYTSSFFMSQDLDPVLENDATNVFNARLGISDTNESWIATAWVRNLTDEEYMLAGFDVPTLSGYASIMAPPRTVGLSIHYNFQ